MSRIFPRFIPYLLSSTSYGDNLHQRPATALIDDSIIEPPCSEAVTLGPFDPRHRKEYARQPFSRRYFTTRYQNHEDGRTYIYLSSHLDR